MRGKSLGKVLLLLLLIPCIPFVSACDDPAEKPIMMGVGTIFYLAGMGLVLGNPFGVTTAVGVGLMEVGLVFWKFG